ncbi:hypothetical protein QJS10_CPA05g02308 [Acorus calamus]|uniref:Sm protein E n=1 Tax=Acorus calamus TaxID=4465 RepID=A0AAV9EX48_ACOCL|nr:hypothetical protein QJS10_CPA05g02308 [Acorus calamus]
MPPLPGMLHPTSSQIIEKVWGFDEYMNLVLEDAEEISVKKNTRKPLGENQDRCTNGSDFSDPARP